MPNFLHTITQAGTPVMLTSALADIAPPALAVTGAAGSSNKVARADHTHPFPTAAQVGAAPASHGHDFSALTNTPTTIAGYGITDAALANHTHGFSAITGVPSTVWMSANRPGPTRLYSTSDDSGQFVHAFLSGGYFRLNGYYANGQLYAGCSVLYADSAATATSASTANSATNATNATWATNLGSYYTADTWFRSRADADQVRFYGNSRTMLFRTDGVASPLAGGYPFIFCYGGDQDAHRKMIIGTDGRIWSSYLGWLDQAFVAKSGGTFDGAVTVNSTLTVNGSVSAVGSWGQLAFQDRGGSSGVTGLWYTSSNMFRLYSTWSGDLWHISSNGSAYFGPTSGTSGGYTTYDGHRLRVASKDASNTSYSIVATNHTNYDLHFWARGDGDLYGNRAWRAPSDIRLKEQIEDLADPLGTILALRPRSFYWRGQPERGRALGFIAQEAAPIVPEAFGLVTPPPRYASGTPIPAGAAETPTFYVAEYTALVAPLVGSVQQLTAETRATRDAHARRLDELAAEVAALKTHAA